MVEFTPAGALVASGVCLFVAACALLYALWPGSRRP